VLREVLPDDLPLLFEYQKDPDANRMAAFTAKDPEDRTAFDAHWSRILSDPTVMMRAVVWKGLVVGNVGSFVDPELGKREVTYWIGKPFWGHGLATKALTRFLEIERTRPLYARAARDNVASLRVLAKCGFVQVGTARGWANARGEAVDEIILEWTPGRLADSGKP
jgi:RimJ/RimL family protein N-acetyltransferase